MKYTVCALVRACVRTCAFMYVSEGATFKSLEQFIDTVQIKGLSEFTIRITNGFECFIQELSTNGAIVQCTKAVSPEYINRDTFLDNYYKIQKVIFIPILKQ